MWAIGVFNMLTKEQHFFKLTYISANLTHSSNLPVIASEILTIIINVRCDACQNRITSGTWLQKRGCNAALDFIINDRAQIATA